MRKKRLAAGIALALAIMVSTASFGAPVRSERPIPFPDVDVEIRNIIMLIPDGLDNNATSLARWLKSYDSETGHVDNSVALNMDELVSGIVRSYWTDGDIIGGIADSAPAATSLATGHLTMNRFLGVTADSVPVASILDAARLMGKSTGLIATSNLQHATPGGFSSHHNERGHYDIIVDQQVHKNIDVVLSAGYRFMIPPEQTMFGHISVTGDRQDDRNLIDTLESRGVEVIFTRDEMLQASDGPLWGFFHPHALAYEIDRVYNRPDEPSLAEMTNVALEILSQNDEGFFLMVEGSKIDWAGHDNCVVGMVHDTLAFDDAVGVALDFAKECGQTMIVISPDHATGGITMGDWVTSPASRYPLDPLATFLAPIARAQLSAEGIAERLNADFSNLEELIKTYWGIYDATEEELAAIMETVDDSPRATTGHPTQTVRRLANIMNTRAYIGWTTNGHTGNDGILYTWLPGDQRIVGFFSTTCVARMMERAWNVDLSEFSNYLFNDAAAAFTAMGATVELNDEVRSAAVMTVTICDNVLLVPQNRNYVFLNDVKHYFDGVMVLSEGVFYVPQSVIDLLK